jgi:hypothetical protein
MRLEDWEATNDGEAAPTKRAAPEAMALRPASEPEVAAIEAGAETAAAPRTTEAWAWSTPLIVGK